MAIWQFTISAVPDMWIAKNRANVAAYVSADCYDYRDPWQEYDWKDAAEQIIDNYMERTESWTHEPSLFGFIRWKDRSGFIRWGDHTSDDVFLSFTNYRIDSLSMRIDMRKYPKDIIDIYVRIAKEMKCSFISLEEREIIPPSIDALMSSALGSRVAEDVAYLGKYLD